MAWIKVDQSLPSHRKTLIASDLLGISPVHLVGHLVTFWMWALDNAPDGYLDGTPASVIGRIAQWEGKGSDFVDALVSAGFLESTEDGIVIHDWPEYAGKLVERRANEKQRQRERRALQQQPQYVAPTSAGREEKRRVEKSRVEKKLPGGAEAPKEVDSNLKEAQVMWESLKAALGSAPETTSARGAWNKAIKELRQANVKPDQISQLCDVYRDIMPPNSLLTPTAIAKNLHILLHPPPKGSGKANEPHVPKGWKGIDEWDVLTGGKDATKQGSL